MSSNKDDIEVLTRYIEKLGDFYKTIDASFRGDSDLEKEWPDALRQRLIEFNESVQEIAQEVQRLRSQRLPARLLNAEDTADEINNYVKRLSMLVHSLIVRGTISIELAVDELQFVVAAGFEHMDDRFDGLSSQIDELSAQINQLMDSSGSGLRYSLKAQFHLHIGDRSPYHASTRREALATVYAWLRPDDPRLATYPPPLRAVQPEKPIFWMNGLAGTGKSTLAQTIAQWCEDARFLGATFFCAHDGDRGNVQLIIPTIAHQLGSFCPDFREEVSKAVKANPDIHGSLLSRQLQKLVLEPLHQVMDKGTFPPCVVIIDALDECKDDDSDVVSVVLRALSGCVSSLAPLKFLITSRPVQRVMDGFRLQQLADNTQEFSLQEIPTETTNRDIESFLRARLADISASLYVEPGWPTEQELKDLVNLTGSLFIFASTAVNFVGDRAVKNPQGQLAFLLHPPELSIIAAARDSPFRHLDNLYLQVLQKAFPGKIRRRERASMKNILGTIALFQEQLHPGALEALLHLESGLVRRTLCDLHSIVVVPPTDEEVIRVIHLSFTDFIVDRNRCTKTDFLVNSSIQHTIIASRCLKTMELLCRDICRLRNETVLNVEIPDLGTKITKHIPPHLQYACKYWSYHFCHAEIDQDVVNELHNFCNTYMLFWLEALSLLGSVDIAIEALQSARHALQKLPLQPAGTLAILYDCERIPNQLPHAHPLHIPSACHTVRIVSGLPMSWSSNVTTTEDHSRRVECVGYSPNGERIVSGSEDASIRLWDARTGAPLHVLEGHRSRVRSVVFSPTGKELLSGSDDLSVKLWDADTGAILGSWTRHTQKVRSVAWSHDGNFAASGSYDTTVVVWPVFDPVNGAVVLQNAHTAQIESIAFASDGDLLSSSHDGTCKVWSVESRLCKRTLTNPSPVMCIAVSRDSQTIACGCLDTSIVLWGKADGVQLHVLRQHASRVWSVDFSPDDQTLVSGSYDHTLRLWDSRSGTHLETLFGHSDQVHCARFSPNGRHIASSESDQSVRIWEVSSEVLDAARRPQKDITHMYRARHDAVTEVYTWDTVTETYSSTGEHHVSMVRVVSLSPDGTLVATAAWDGTIRLWDIQTGARLKTLVGHKHLVTSVTWALSGLWLSSTGYNDHTVRVWNSKTGICVETLGQHAGGVWMSLFTHDERQLVSSSDDGTIRLWNLGGSGKAYKSGAISEVLFQGTGPVYAFALSPNSKWILSGSLDKTPVQLGEDMVGPTRDPVQIAEDIPGVWDQAVGYPTLRLQDTSGHIFWMENHTALVTSLAFSSDCTCALSGSGNGELFLYDLREILPPGVAAPRLEKHPAAVTSHMFLVGDGNPVEHISFSADERAINTDASHTPLESKLWPDAAHLGSPIAAPLYFLFEGWLWRAAPEPRRICWVPSSFRHYRNERAFLYRGNMATTGHMIAFGTHHGQLVILDVSAC